MKNPKSIHEDEWSTGWKARAEALSEEGRFKLISKIAAGLAPELVFDLGCGDGHQGKILKENLPGVTVNGCDISTTAVEKSSAHMDSVYVCNIDESKLPEESETYDLVVCIAVLEHLYDVSHALKEIHRILKPGKHAIIQVPNLAYWRFRLAVLMGKIPYILLDPRHLHSFNKYFLIEILQRTGLNISRIFGQGQRLQWLAAVYPSLFSETLFVLAEKRL